MLNSSFPQGTSVPSIAPQDTVKTIMPVPHGLGYDFAQTTIQLKSTRIKPATQNQLWWLDTFFI